MTKKKPSGIFRKIFGGRKQDNCCAIEIEEIPAPELNSEKETPERQIKEKHHNNGCDSCSN